MYHIMHTSCITTYIMHCMHPSCMHPASHCTSYIHHMLHACVIHHTSHHAHIIHAPHIASFIIHISCIASDIMQTSCITSYIIYHCQGMAHPSNIQGSDIKFIYVPFCLAGFLFFFWVCLALLLSQLQLSLLLNPGSRFFPALLFRAAQVHLGKCLPARVKTKAPPELAGAKQCYLAQHFAGYQLSMNAQLKTICHQAGQTSPSWADSMLTVVSSMKILTPGGACVPSYVFGICTRKQLLREALPVHLTCALSPGNTSQPLSLLLLSLKPLTSSTNRCILLVHLRITLLSLCPELHLAHRKH